LKHRVASTTLKMFATDSSESREQITNEYSVILQKNVISLIFLFNVIALLHILKFGNDKL